MHRNRLTLADFTASAFDKPIQRWKKYAILHSNKQSVARNEKNRKNGQIGDGNRLSGHSIQFNKKTHGEHINICKKCHKICPTVQTIIFNEFFFFSSTFGWQCTLILNESNNTTIEINCWASQKKHTLKFSCARQVVSIRTVCAVCVYTPNSMIYCSLSDQLKNVALAWIALSLLFISVSMQWFAVALDTDVDDAAVAAADRECSVLCAVYCAMICTHS